MRSSDLRASAREILKKGNYWYLFLAVIVLAAIAGLLGLTMVGAFLMGPFVVGLNYYYLKVSREGETDIVEFFKPVTENLMNSLVLGILKVVYIMLWTMLFIIPGIVKGYSYSMAEKLMADDKTLTGTEAITKSRQLMDGHKFRLFMLHFSFIGWIILGILTFGIGLIFLQPYMIAADTAFYQDLIKDNLNFVEENKSNDYDYHFE